jgi:hypothetical protein
VADVMKRERRLDRGPLPLRVEALVHRHFGEAKPDHRALGDSLCQFERLRLQFRPRHH